MPPTSWASTLRLPKSSFPARLGAREKLSRYNKRCTDDLYAWQRKASHGSRFVLHDGPPYANGDLHIGHALNKILKDITCRFQVLEGKRVSFRPGWDCHGLPIEIKALQSRQSTIGQDASSLDALQVRKLARGLAGKTVEKQKAEFREWAIMADWDNAWKTMDQGYELRQLEVFKSMVQKGQIYRQLKPVYWSPSTRTALAEAELEYKSDHQSTAAFVLFPLLNLTDKLLQMLPNPSDSVNLVIWTTTPWTIPANKAIAVHRRLEYVLIRDSLHGFLLVAKSRLSDFESWMQQSSERGILETCMGEDLVGQTYCHPLFAERANAQPILHGDFVSADSGTGLVHVAPGHGMDDYKLCQEHGIEPFAPIDNIGRFTHEAMPDSPKSLEGKDILGDGNTAVLDLLKQRNSLVAIQKYKHKYPYDWRSKQPVVIRATWQWFADLSGIREAALKALETVKFVPADQNQRLSSFVRGRSEWCISRQRAWGVPIPALYRVEDGEALMTAETIDHILSLLRKRGTDAWWADDPHEEAWILPSIKDQGPFIRGKETMDVWFDSGTSWKELGEHSSKQIDTTADVYLEGTDQHRGWFQSSLLTRIASQMSLSNAATQIAPFKTLITHGFTLDSSGRKMSKSEGNVIAPEDISNGTLLPPKKAKKGNALAHEGFGPDALRLWVASCDSANDVQIGEAVAKAVNGNMAKLRVTFKLLTGLLDTHDADRTVAFESLGAVDRIALSQLESLLNDVYSAYRSYEYHRATAAIIAYVNTAFSGLYIESAKDCLYASAVDSKRRINAQIVLWEIFKTLSHLLYPITPLLVEESLDHLPLQLQYFHPVKNMHGPEARLHQRAVKGPWTDSSFGNAYLPILNAEVKALQELARNQKKLGSSLQSYVALEIMKKGHNSDDAHKDSSQILQERLSGIAHALEELLVVSKVDVHVYPNEHGFGHAESAVTSLPAVQTADWAYARGCMIPVGDAQVEVLISVYAPTAVKCARCWKYNVAPPQKELKLEEDVCERCLGVLEGSQDESFWHEKPHMKEAALRCRDEWNQYWEGDKGRKEMVEHWCF